MNRFIFVFCVIFNCLSSVKSDDQYGYTIKNKIHFPYSAVFVPYIGWLTAFSVPLAPPYKSVSVAYNFEANYNLPQNETEYTYPPVISRLFQRNSFYKMLELKLNNDGYKGKSCLLRMICQMSQYSSKHTGVLGDILDILLRPSTSVNQDLPRAYNEAEEYGYKRRHCKKYLKKCSIDFLEFISSIENFVENI